MREENIEIFKLIKCIICTFVWGIVAHAYAFLNLTVSRDSLEALYSSNAESIWKISIGRVFVPVYRAVVRGFLTSPWLIGVIALLWIGLSVFMIAEIFNIDSNGELLLISGIMTTNLTVTSLAATYMHDFDVDMFALLLAVGAVYLWNKTCKDFWKGIPLIAIMLGLYQSYFSVAIILIMLVIIFELVKGKTFAEVFKSGISGILMLFAGGSFYLLLSKAICWGTQVQEASSYNSSVKVWEILNGGLIWKIAEAYELFWNDFFNPISMSSSYFLATINMFLLIYVCGYVVCFLAKRERGIAEKLLFVILICLVPLVTNLSYVLSGGILHSLMKYAFWLIYLFVILAMKEFRLQVYNANMTTKVYRIIFLLIFIIVWNNIPVANAAYLKKDLERQQTLTMMTQVIGEIEKEEGYIDGQTPVAFIGKIYRNSMPGFEMFEGDGSRSGLIGLNENYQIKNWRDYRSFFYYMLNRDINICEYDQYAHLLETEEIADMPVFPAEGYIKYVDDILVIKMGTDY